MMSPLSKTVAYAVRRDREMQAVAREERQSRSRRNATPDQDLWKILETLRTDLNSAIDRALASIARERSKRTAIPGHVMDLIVAAAGLERVPVELVIQPRGRGRNYDPVVQARRRVAMALRAKGLSYPLIGSYLNVHHSSVMHLCKETKCPDLDK